MRHPHSYSPESAPKAYLKRIFKDSRPRQITFAGMIGTYRLFVLDLSEQYEQLKPGEGKPDLTEEILNDRSGVHGVFGPIAHYVLVIDQQPVAIYDLDGRYVEEAVGVELTAVHAEAKVAGSNASLKIADS